MAAELSTPLQFSLGERSGTSDCLSLGSDIEALGFKAELQLVSHSVGSAFVKQARSVPSKVRQQFRASGVSISLVSD